MKLLIIEDHKRIALGLKEYLENENFEVDIALDGEYGLQQAISNKYDIIILDIKLPNINGIEVCKILRSQNINTPIIMLTALTDKESIIKGLKSGADDYINKPFEAEEILARINAVLRRDKSIKTNQIYITKDILINLDQNIVYKNNEPLKLSPKEYELLKYLVLNNGKCISAVDIIDKVWDNYDDLMFSRTIDVHIAHLRRKLDKSIIQTIKNKGYILNISNNV